MSEYRTRKKLTLVKPEATSGTEETPTVSADAIDVEDSQWTPEFELDETNEETASLDSQAPIVGGGKVTFACSALLKGSGVGNTAPDWIALARACALAVTLTAAVTGTAQAGAGTSITLAAGASAVDGAYIGMPIDLTGGTGSGQPTNVITAYNGTTKVATVLVTWATPPDGTTLYSIPANTLLVPASNNLETVTAWNYQIPTDTSINAILRKVIAAAGNMSFDVNPRKVSKVQFNLTGILPAVPAGVAVPAAATFDTTRPPPWVNAQVYLGGAAIKINRVSLDLQNQAEQADDPASTYGFDIAGVVDRKVSGVLRPNLVVPTTRDTIADFIAGTERSFWTRWGATAGNRISLYNPALRYTGATPEDERGFSVENVPFRAVGIDSGAYICLH